MLIIRNRLKEEAPEETGSIVTNLNYPQTLRIFMISFSDIDLKKQERLIALEKKHNKLLNKADKIKNNRYRRKEYLSLLKSASETKQSVYKLLVPIFTEHNKEFREIATKNLELTGNRTLNLSAKRIIGNYKSYSSEAFNGIVDKKGYVTCTPLQIPPSNDPLDFSYRCPKLYKGYINCLGNIHLEIKKRDNLFFQRFPEKYECKIDDKGEITLEVTKSIKPYPDKEIPQGYIFGAIFRNISEKNSFFENRAKLIDIINDYRELYLKDIKK